MRYCIFALFFLLPGLATLAGQTAQPPAAHIPKPDELKPEDKRILGLLANYKTVPDSSLPYEPISTREKFYIARRDSFDPPMFFFAGVMAGMSHLGNQYPSWGQGAKGFSRRYAAAIGDQVIGNHLTEAILPTLLHQDPRYFRLGKGSVGKRIGYAMTRVLVTRNDSGKSVFNLSEIGGTATAATIASVYYPRAQRNPGDVAIRFGTQVAFDSLSAILKEYWPDLHRKLKRKK